MTDGGEDDRLERAVAARREAEGLRARLDAATAYADGTTARAQEARDHLGAEERDVARLEGVSWSRVLVALRGSTATAREREQAERDAARYRLADAQARDDLAWREVEALQAQLDALGDVEAELAEAMGERERWAARHGTEQGRLLDDLGRRRGDLIAEDRESRQAFDVGQTTRTHLREALRLLGSAGSWSTWDAFGGGLLTDMMKYDRLDQVAVVMRHADAALARFTHELQDVHLPGVRGVDLDPMTRAFDVFFDDIFSDLRVRGRIQESHVRVRSALDQVESVMNRLSTRGREIRAELDDLDRQREHLLLTPPLDRG